MRLRRLVVVPLAVVALVGVGAAVLLLRARAGASAPVILENGKTHYGKTYGEWGSAWWRWLYESPQSGHRCMLADDDMTGEHCGFGQHDPDVFFLAGTRGAKVLRTKCVVPRGRALFFPVMTWISDNGGVAAEEVLPPEEMVVVVDSAMDRAIGLFATVDGVEVDLSKQRVSATRFSYTLPPEPNYYSCVGSHVVGRIDPAYHRGIWVMLAPLPPGPHEIAFRGRVPRSTGEFVIDVAYHLRIE